MIVKPRSNRKPLYVVLSVILVLLLSGLTYAYKNNFFFFKDSSPTTAKDSINLEPPTEEDKKEAESNKQRLIEEDRQQDNVTSEPEPSSDNKQKVTPIIGFVEQSDNKDIEANGYIPQVIEKNGTCILTLEKQGQKVTESKRALPDAQGTVCGLLSIERSRLSTGEWRATITYSSDKYEGVSKEEMVKVN